MHDRLIIWGFFAVLGLGAGTMAALHPNVRKPKPPPRIEPIPITVVAESTKADKLQPPWHPEWVSNDPPTAPDLTPTPIKTVAVAPLFRPMASNPKFEPLPAPIISAQTEFPKLPQPKIEKKESADKSDICARHGMHRKTHDGGRRWRCEK